MTTLAAVEADQGPPNGGSETGLFQRVNARYERAKAMKDLWAPLFDDCYDYAFPHRRDIYESTPGESRISKIYDSTAVIAVQEFASRLQAGLVPEYARWAKLTSGTLVPSDLRAKFDRKLEDVTSIIFEHVQSSNFAQEAHEALLDLVVGTGVLVVEPRDGPEVMHFAAVPLNQVVLDTGPFGELDWFFRPRMVRLRDITTIWPRATLSERMAEEASKDDQAKTLVVDCVYRDWSFPTNEAYRTVVFAPSYRHVLWSTGAVGRGSCPVIAFRWSKASGEVYGRGPLLSVLADVKTLNLAVQMVLENAEFAINGAYQTDNDSIFNEETVRLQAGMVYYRDPNSQGIQPIESPSRFDLAQFVFDEMRANIKKGLYDDMLGAVDGAVKSATEIAVRQAELARRIGSPFGRLQAELVQPLISRIAYILKRRGLITLPRVDGREVRVHSISPLAQAQMQDDVIAMDQFAEMLSLRFGPELMPVVMKPEQYAKVLAEKKGVPGAVLRDPDEVEKILAALAQQQTAQQGAS